MKNPDKAEGAPDVTLLNQFDHILTALHRIELIEGQEVIITITNPQGGAKQS